MFTATCTVLGRGMSIQNLRSVSQGDYDVVANLLTYFMFLLGIELFFLVLPIVIAHWEIHKELRVSPFCAK